MFDADLPECIQSNRPEVAITRAFENLVEAFSSSTARKMRPIDGIFKRRL